MSLYSDKVMDHFQNPRNVGEIKNPDGVGEVGNPVCLTPKSIIHINSDIAEIDSLKKGVKVLSHDGVYNKIKKIFDRDFKGDIYKIYVGNLGNVELTPEHLILGLKISQWQHKFQAAKKQVLDWHQASELKKGDFLAFPIPKEEKENKFFKIEEPKKKYDYKSANLPEKIEADKDFLKLIGFYLAEGYVRTDKCKGTLGFVFGSGEESYVAFIEKVMKNKLGLISGKIVRKNNSIHLVFYNARLARIFEREFGKGALNKKIPHWAMVLPLELQKSLLYGLWNGDGYLNNKTAKFVTISEKLAHQVKLLLLRQKIIFCFLESPAKGIHKKYFSIYLKNQDSLKTMADIVGKKFVAKERKKYPKKSWYDNNYYHVPVKKIEKIKYKGEVLNLEVADSHSYTTSAACVHNCGDIMKIFIRVSPQPPAPSHQGGENPSQRPAANGQRLIISDIKFQTFGCGAAIATSSIITELVKGKTLEEAEKISNQTVAEALDGLPPIKMHCSNLAADALKKAITDYRSKNPKH